MEEEPDLGSEWLSAADVPANGDRRGKKKRRECHYGEKCYRKAPRHFEEFEHSHLETLLEIIGDVDGEITEVPQFYSPKISKITLIEQLNFERKLNSKYNQKSSSDECLVGHTSPKSDRVSSSSGSIGQSSSVGQSSSSSSDGPIFKVPFSQSNTSKTAQKRGGISSQKNLDNENDKSKKSREADSASSSTSYSSSSSSRSRQINENKKEAENYRIVVWDRRKGKVTDKLNCAAPYNFFLTTITDSKPTHSEELSICFPELLDPTLGDLESSLQVNFMVEFGWLLAQYHIMGHRCKPLTLIYGEIDMDPGENTKHFLTHAKIIPPSSFGSHHTKLMIFSYKDESIRIVISTANLVESDWDNRTQGLWVSERCPKLDDESDTSAGESVTGFKRSFIRYLAAYQIPELQSWVGKVQRADMSAINVFFIGSIPGSHTTFKNHWGHLALAETLKEKIIVPDRNSYQVIVQCSSIGSLGPKPDSWLLGDMMNVFCSGKKMGLVSRPQLKFIYPSFNNVANSHDGLLGGGCLPYSRKTHLKQEWLSAFLCQWKSDGRYRSKAPPHIKSYCRVSSDHSKMSYFLLTSANMSKAAWGTHSKSGTLNILSYEAGVLFLPQFVIGEEFFPLKKLEGMSAPVFPMPYDLPVTPYDQSDLPWFIENLM